MTIEQFILDYIREHRSVTFDALKGVGHEAGYTMHGKFKLELEGECFGEYMSEEFFDAVLALIGKREIEIAPSPPSVQVVEFVSGHTLLKHMPITWVLQPVETVPT
jgi:hypothetical protein